MGPATLVYLVEHCRDGILRTTLDGDLLYSNDEAARMLGYDSAKQILAAVRRVTDLYVDPSDRKRFIQNLQGPTPKPFETRLLRRDGSHVWVEIRARLHAEPGAEFVVEGTFRDLTARRERDELVRRLAAVVEFSEEAIYTKDLNGVVNTWNTAAESIFGHTSTEAIGQPIRDLIIPDHKVPEYDRFMERLRAGESIPRHDNVRQRKDGSQIPVSMTLVPIPDADGRVVSISVSAHDITDRLRAEEAERARIEIQHLRQLDLTLREFINAAAHDLNQPLTPMRLALATLEESLESAPHQAGRSLKTLNRSVDRMALLVADLLDVARLESGTLHFDFTPVDLGDSLREVHDIFEAAAKQKDVDWTIDAPTSLLVAADARRLMQVLVNLVGNTFKYTPPGGSVHAVAARREQSVRVSVKDTGTGLTPEQIERLFRPFSQAHTHIPDAPQGTGLGLYISKGIVEAHGGSIGVESEGEGKGATFWFEIPVGRPVDGAAPNGPAPRVNGPADGSAAEPCG